MSHVSICLSTPIAGNKQHSCLSWERGGKCLLPRLESVTSLGPDASSGEEEEDELFVRNRLKMFPSFDYSFLSTSLTAFFLLINQGVQLKIKN